MESSTPSLWAFVLAIIVGIAWAIGARIVDAIWPRKVAA